MMSRESVRGIWTSPAAVAGAAGRAPRLGVARMLVVDEDHEKAWAIARRAYRVWVHSFHYLWKDKGYSPVFGWRPETYDGMAELGVAFAGTPDEIAEQFQTHIDETGSNYAVAQFSFGDLSLAETDVVHRTLCHRRDAEAARRARARLAELGEPQARQRRERHDAGGGGEVDAAHRAGPHRDPQGAIGMRGQHPGGSAPVSRPNTSDRRARTRPRCTAARRSSRSTSSDQRRRGAKGRERRVHDDAHGVPVVEPGALEGAVVDAEAQRLDQMQRAAGRGAQPRDVAGVGRNLRFDEHDVERRVADVGEVHDPPFGLRAHVPALRSSVHELSRAARRSARRRRGRASALEFGARIDVPHLPPAPDR